MTWPCYPLCRRRRRIEPPNHRLIAQDEADLARSTDLTPRSGSIKPPTPSGHHCPINAGAGMDGNVCPMITSNALKCASTLPAKPRGVLTISHGARANFNFGLGRHAGAANRASNQAPAASAAGAVAGRRVGASTDWTAAQS
jgi:hypothetical protein